MHVTSTDPDVAKDWHLLEGKVFDCVRIEKVVDLLILFPMLDVLAGLALYQLSLLLLKLVKLL